MLWNRNAVRNTAGNRLLAGNHHIIVAVSISALLASIDLHFVRMHFLKHTLDIRIRNRSGLCGVQDGGIRIAHFLPDKALRLERGGRCGCAAAAVVGVGSGLRLGALFHVSLVRLHVLVVVVLLDKGQRADVAGKEVDFGVGIAGIPKCLVNGLLQ